MSTATRLRSIAAPETVEVDRLRSTIERGIEFAGFWLAVILPFAYLPLLHAEPVSWTGLAFVGLLAINLLALLVGHGYKR